jgi:hypothetical protein
MTQSWRPIYFGAFFVIPFACSAADFTDCSAERTPGGAIETTVQYQLSGAGQPNVATGQAVSRSPFMVTRLLDFSLGTGVAFQRDSRSLQDYGRSLKRVAAGLEARQAPAPPAHLPPRPLRGNTEIPVPDRDVPIINPNPPPPVPIPWNTAPPRRGFERMQSPTSVLFRLMPASSAYAQPVQSDICTRDVVSEYVSARNAALAFADGSTLQLLRYVEQGHTDSRISEFTGAQRKLLRQCFIPVEESAFAIERNLHQRLATLTQANNPLCSATLLRTGRHVLTARH